ncbi:hypothetical protein OROHE_002719 [Orobanche hederae]
MKISLKSDGEYLSAKNSLSSHIQKRTARPMHILTI